MSKFLDTINEKLNLLNEAEPAQIPDLPADPAAAPESAPAETPGTALPDLDIGEDDTTKLKVDYVEMIRKALIMAPKHIDDVDYAKLTKIVDTENLEEMQELVSRIVRNNYPHPDL